MVLHLERIHPARHQIFGDRGHRGREIRPAEIKAGVADHHEPDRQRLPALEPKCALAWYRCYVVGRHVRLALTVFQSVTQAPSDFDQVSVLIGADDFTSSACDHVDDHPGSMLSLNKRRSGGHR